jgi:hypothetical protein
LRSDNVPRTKKVSIAGRELLVEERRIGELKQLVADLFPGSGGKLSEIDPSKLFELDVDDVLSKKLPEMFPGLSAEDVDNAYMSEIEALVEAFVDVNFFGLKRLVAPLMQMAQAGAMQQTVAAPPLKTPTSRRAGTTRKR